MPMINIIFLAIVVGALTVFALTLAWGSHQSARLAAGRTRLAEAGRAQPPKVGNNAGAVRPAPATEESRLERFAAKA